MTRFSEMVRSGMRQQGLTLRALCRRAGTDPSYLSKVLAGKRSPPAEERALRRLAKALELDEAELVVAAGRIPSEWSRLWEDPRVFESIRRLASGPAAAAAERPPKIERPALSEELL